LQKRVAKKAPSVGALIWAENGSCTGEFEKGGEYKQSAYCAEPQINIHRWGRDRCIFWITE
jgi:hypothetical protein